MNPAAVAFHLRLRGVPILAAATGFVNRWLVKKTSRPGYVAGTVTSCSYVIHQPLQFLDRQSPHFFLR